MSLGVTSSARITARGRDAGRWELSSGTDLLVGHSAACQEVKGGGQLDPNDGHLQGAGIAVGVMTEHLDCGRAIPGVRR